MTYVNDVFEMSRKRKQFLILVVFAFWFATWIPFALFVKDQYYTYEEVELDCTPYEDLLLCRPVEDYE